MPNFCRPVTYFCRAGANALLLGVLLSTATNATAADTPQSAKAAASAPNYRIIAETVEAQDLPPLEPGLATPQASGLREDLWDKMTYATWGVLLNGLPQEIPSPAIRTITANALLSNAETPHGDVSKAAEQDTRSNALLSFVTADTYRAYVATIAEKDRTTLTLTRQRELNFIEQGAAACPTLPADNGSMNDMLWRLYCILADTGNPNHLYQAQLQLDLLAERGEQTRSEVTLASVLVANETSDQPTPLPLSNNPTVLHLRLASLAKNQPLNVNSDIPLIYRARAFIMLERGGSEGATAAEWLAGNGFITADVLRDAYNAVGFAATDRADPNYVNRLEGATQRAFIWQQLADSSDSDDQLRLLNDFINAGGVNAVLGVRGEILAPYLGRIQSSTTTAWAAPAMMALAAAQHVPAAQNDWYAAAATAAETMPDAAKWLTRLWPLAVALQLPQADITMAPTWIANAQANSPDYIPVADTLSILGAAGFAVSQEAWASVTDTLSAPKSGTFDAKQLERLLAAAKANNQGEVVLRTAVMMGDSTTQPPVVAYAGAIRALADVDLPDAARRLTVEALLRILFTPA